MRVALSEDGTLLGGGAAGLLASLLLAAPAPAEETPPPPQPTPIRWAPPEPSDSDYDWIQLGSGEWLKGDFEHLRDRKVAFDSDELDDLELDFSDITRFRLPRPHSYRVESREVHRGSAEMRDGFVRVQTAAGIAEFHRDELVSIVQGSGRERDRWSTKVGLGVGIQRGNTEQSDFTGSVKIRRESALTRWRIDYNGAISSVDGDRTTNNHRANTRLDAYLTQRLFLTVPFFEFFRDPFQNISQRYTPGAGIGYEFVRRSWLEWEASVGAAYQYTRFLGGDSASDFATLFGTEFDLDFDAFEWDNGYRIQLVPTDIGKTSHHLESVFSFDVWGPLDFDVSFIWDRILKPETDASGDRPKSNDVRLTVGLGLDL